MQDSCSSQPKGADGPRPVTVTTCACHEWLNGLLQIKPKPNFQSLHNPSLTLEASWDALLLIPSCPNRRGCLQG